MPVSFIQVAPDSTGKKLRTYDKGVEGHQLYYERGYARNVYGEYLVAAGPFTLAAAAHTATGGFFWLINPVESTVNLVLEYIHFMAQLTVSTPVLASAPRISFERVTFTGTASGTEITAAKRKSTDGDPFAKVLTTSTGLTLTDEEAIVALLPPANLSTGTTTATPRAMQATHFFGLPTVGTEVILAPGEGVVCRQADAGSTSEAGRRFIVNIAWTGFTEP